MSDQAIIEDVWQELSVKPMMAAELDIKQSVVDTESIANEESTSSEMETVEENSTAQGNDEDQDAFEQKHFDEGYQKGKLETEEKLNAEIESLKQQNSDTLKKQSDLLSEIADKISQETLKFTTEFDETIKDIILKISQAVIQAELTLAPEKIKHAISDALLEVRNVKDIKLFIHPDNAPLLADMMKEKNIVLSTDSNLGMQDFYITNEFSRIEGGLVERINQSIESVYKL